jgi:hypothetical protein
MQRFLHVLASTGNIFCMYLLAPDLTHVRSFIVFIQVSVCAYTRSQSPPYDRLCSTTSRITPSFLSHSLAISCSGCTIQIDWRTSLATSGASAFLPQTAFRFVSCPSSSFISPAPSPSAPRPPPTILQIYAVYPSSWSCPRLCGLPRGLVCRARFTCVFPASSPNYFPAPGPPSSTTLSSSGACLGWRASHLVQFTRFAQPPLCGAAAVQARRGRQFHR